MNRRLLRPLLPLAVSAGGMRIYPTFCPVPAATPLEFVVVTFPDSACGELETGIVAGSILGNCLGLDRRLLRRPSSLAARASGSFFHPNVRPFWKRTCLHDERRGGLRNFCKSAKDNRPQIRTTASP